MSFDLNSKLRYIQTKFKSFTETNITDLAINGSNTNQVTSSSVTFHVGDQINLLSNTALTPGNIGWYAGSYTVTGVGGGNIATVVPLANTTNPSTYLANPYPGTASSVNGTAIVETLLQDLSTYLISADTTHTDEIKAHQGTFVFANPQGIWDKYAGSTVLVEDRLITYQKGYSATPGGAVTWYPQFKGRIARANPHYQRFAPNGSPMNGNGELISVDCVDLMKNPIRQVITSDPYYNSTIDNVAGDILLRYAYLPATNFYASSYNQAFYQALSQSVIDILSTLYDVPLEFVWSDYSGVVNSYPRLGSGGQITLVSPGVVGSGYTVANVIVTSAGGGGSGALITANIVSGSITSYTIVNPGDGYVTEPTITVLGDGAGATATATIGGTGLVGYPDATSAPTATPAWTFSDGSLIHYIDETWQDFELINQVRVLGQSLVDTTSLGGYQCLANVGTALNPEFISPGKGHTYIIPFSSTNNSENIVTATNIYVKFYTPSLGNFGAPSNPGLFGVQPYAYLIYGGGSSSIQTLPVCSDTPAGTPRNPFAGLQFPHFGPVGAQFSQPWGVTWERPDSAPPAPCASLTWINGGGGQEGGFNIGAQSQQSIQCTAYANSDQGGFGFVAEVWGQPVIVQQQTLQKYIDYNVTYTSANGQDIFGDHTTYQLPNAPMAMGTPFELQIIDGANPLLNTTLSVTYNPATVANPLQITLASVLHLVAGQTIRLGTQANGNAEYPIVQSISGLVVTLSESLVYTHLAGDAVIGLGGFLPAAGGNLTPFNGVVSADGLYSSSGFQVDFERGRVAFTTRLYVPYSVDHAYTGINTYGFVGGNSLSNAAVANLGYVQPTGSAAPEAVYQTFRNVSSVGSYFQYTFTGLAIGLGYTIRCHFADPYSTSAGKRAFNIFVNQLQVETGFDIIATSGNAGNAVVLDITGIAAIVSGPDAGKIVIQFGGTAWNTNNPHPGSSDSAIVSGIEIFLPNGGVGDAYAINCGGPAITPTPPTIHSPGHGYSPIQQQYGIQSFELDDPLLKTIGECTVTGQFFLNQSAWARNPITLRTASIPTLTPATMIKAFNPRIGPPNGSDMYLYVQGIQRHTERPTPDASGSPIDGEVDYDTYTAYLLYISPR